MPPPPEPAAAPSGARAGSWFDVADEVVDRLVPAEADWVLLHVRSSVLSTLRAGHGNVASVGPARPGESFGVVALRHRDAELEVALAGVVEALTPRVGDGYGSGRVTATGRSRLATEVDPAHLRAIARDETHLRQLLALDLGGAVIVPVVQGSVVIGALNVVRSRRRTVADIDLADVERLGVRLGQALQAALPATVAERNRGRPEPTARWRPGGTMPAQDLRRWVRRTLPEVVDRPVRPGLVDELDLVASELVSNAERHGGGCRAATLRLLPDGVRLAVLDHADRGPVVRVADDAAEGGRGMWIVASVCRAWGVARGLQTPGKAVWAEFAR